MNKEFVVIRKYSSIQLFNISYSISAVRSIQLFNPSCSVLNIAAPSRFSFSAVQPIWSISPVQSSRSIIAVTSKPSTLSCSTQRSNLICSISAVPSYLFNLTCSIWERDFGSLNIFECIFSVFFASNPFVSHTTFSVSLQSERSETKHFIR